MVVGVVGAGAMGRGIAQVAAVAGHDVRLFDMSADAVASAISSIGESLGRSLARGRVSQEQLDSALARVHGAASLEEFVDCELVIEAVVERLDVKQAVFSQLEQIVSDDAILASNTSSLSIGSICAGVARPDRLIGLHFFNPVPAMELVEIVGTALTQPSALDRAREFVASIGKTGVAVVDSPGFLVNLAGRAYGTEALAILQEGIASVEQIDRIAKENLGFALGPFELMDLTGLDVNYTVTENLFHHNFGDPRLRSTWFHRYLYDARMLGRKTGRGFHDYQAADAPAQVESTNLSSLPLSDVTVALAGERQTQLSAICRRAEVQIVSMDEADLILVAPLGTDCSQLAMELGLDPVRTVGLDLLLPEPAVQTLMVGPGAPEEPVARLVARLSKDASVEVIRDSPGFVAQRLLAAIINLASDIAQRAIASPRDIDTAVKLGLRYPHGPLEWADLTGLDTIVDVLDGMSSTTGDPRYTVSPWLRRRRRAGLSALTPDFTTTQHSSQQ